MQHPAADSTGKAEGGEGRPAGDRQPIWEAGVGGKPGVRMETPGLPGQNSRYTWLRHQGLYLMFLPLPDIADLLMACQGHGDGRQAIL